MNLKLLLFALVFPAFIGGCGECADCYLACDLGEADCNSAEASCVVTNSLACDSGICARFEGGDPVCTRACDENNDCGDDQLCVEYVLQSGAKYCNRDS